MPKPDRNRRPKPRNSADPADVGAVTFTIDTSFGKVSLVRHANGTVSCVLCDAVGHSIGFVQIDPDGSPCTGLTWPDTGILKHLLTLTSEGKPRLSENNKAGRMVRLLFPVDPLCPEN